MRVLIIDDEESIRKTTGFLLDSLGYESVGAENRAAALRQMNKAHFDVVFLDLKLEDENGLDLLPDLLKTTPKLDVIVCTAYASIETAVEAMRRGATDYLPKPFTPEQVRQVLGKIIKTRKLADRVAELESWLAVDSPNADLRTKDAAVERVLQIARKVASTPASVLILGESGTGKTILARAMHSRSLEKAGAFVTISCPSLSRELLESELFGRVKGAYTGAASDTWGKVAAADGGTLFLDEIGELPLEIQPKLLRLLQEKEYERVGEAKTRRANVRVLAATNRNLEEAVREGRFREDLFYRLNVITLTLPPLRERLSDLATLAEGYLKFFSAQCGKHLSGFSADAVHAMRNYSWPGNVRELRNVVEHVAILAPGPQVELADLPEKLSLAGAASGENGGVQVGMPVALEELETEHIRRIVSQAPTMDEAARILGIGRSTLYKKTRSK
ncbi:MAG: sigma-54-dependent Fis family transcriptional regulator [Verrucomicrobia bacterium]|nr:sigma-54-dependent Fis family transcriptional regulator [Verrucomicrobiota bacterium]